MNTFFFKFFPQGLWNVEKQLWKTLSENFSSHSLWKSLSYPQG